jgi:tripartite-type tricarboxylate transporter receptor subunit TctC
MQFDQLHRRKLITLLGGAPMPMTPAELGKLIADDVAKWATVIRAANIKLD